MSGEHIISKAILGLEGAFDVERNGGLPVRIGKGSLTGKMLCTSHNSQLSDLDSEAQNLYEGLKSIHATGKASQVDVRVDSRKLEAWLTKTLINSVVSGFSDIARSSPRRQAAVEQRLIDIVVGKRRYSNWGRGLSRVSGRAARELGCQLPLFPDVG